MKSELISLLGKDIVEILNAWAQVVAYICGLIAVYKLRIFRIISNVLSNLAELHKFFFYSKVSTTRQDLETGEYATSARTAAGLIVNTGKLLPNGAIVKDGQKTYKVIEEKREDLPFIVYVLIATLFVSCIFIVGSGWGYWAKYPFLQFGNAVGVWGDLILSWNVVIIPLKSVLYFIWGIASFALIYTIGLGAFLKFLFKATNWFYQRLSEKLFYFFLFLALVISGFVVIATSTDLVP